MEKARPSRAFSHRRQRDQRGGDRQETSGVRADFDAFAPRIIEGMAAAGMEPQHPPDIKEFPVHEMIGA